MRLTLEHEGKRYVYELRKQTTTIGRDPKCDVALPTATVSRFHAQCVQEGDDCVLKDLGSRNGIWVNRARVREVRLRDGDLIQMGKIALRFEAAATGGVPKGFQPAAEEPPPPPPPPAAGGDQPTPVDVSFSEAEVREIQQPPRPAKGARDAPGAKGGADGMIVAVGRHWKWAIAAFLAFDVLAIGLWMAFSSKDGEPAKKGGKPSPAARSRALEKVALRMQEARRILPEDAMKAAALWKESRAELDEIQREGSDKVTAELARLLDLWQKVHADYSNFPWDEAQPTGLRLRDLADSPKAPEQVRAVAEEWAGWLTRLAKSREEFRKIDALLDPKGGLRVWQEAYAKLQMADRESLFWPPYERRTAELRGWIVDELHQRAQRAFEEGKWDAALSAAAEAAEFGPEEPRFAEIRSGVSRERAAEGKLARARQAFEAGEDEEAEALARAVPDLSRCAAEARALLKQIAARAQQVEILRLFNAGQAKEALEKLRDLPQPDEELAGLVKRVEALWTRAQEAERRLDFDEMILQTGEILKALEDEVFARSRYRVESLQMRSRWDTPAKRAKRFYEEGKAAEAKGNLPAAYGWWGKAQKADPSGGWAAEEVRTYADRSRALYNDALLLAESDPAQARAKLIEASKWADPASDLATRIRDAAERLPR